MNVSKAGLRTRNITLKRLIAHTYGVRRDRVIGGPKWIDVNTYEVIGRTNDPTATTAMVHEMVKALMADRFGLRVHTESRPATVLALLVARRDGRLGPNLKPSAGCQKGGVSGSIPTFGKGGAPMCGTRAFFDRGTSRVEAGARPIADLVQRLDGWDGKRVVDKTGLDGVFDFDLRFRGPLSASTDAEPSELVDLMTAVREQLGLELKPEPGFVDVLVVDDAQLPSPN